MLCYRIFFFQAEDGIRDLVRSRGLGDVYKRQQCGLHESHTIHKRWGKALVASWGDNDLTGGDVLQLSLIHI